MNLIEELQAKNNALEQCLRTLRKNGETFAKAEHDYKVVLRQEVLKLRADGEAIGVIDKICYGVESVAEKRLLRDVAKTTYEANKEAVNVYKLQIKLLESQLDREWRG